jgi:hypothetical protein
MGAVKSRTTTSEPPPLPTRFTWEEYSRLRELPGPVYEIAAGLFVYETTVYVQKPTTDDDAAAEEETCEIRFFSENPLSEGVVYLSLCGYKLVFEHFHNRGVEVYEKLRAGLFVPVGVIKRRRVFFDRPRVYDRPATEPRVCHERSTEEEYLQFIFE